MEDPLYNQLVLISQRFNLKDEKLLLDSLKELNCKFQDQSLVITDDDNHNIWFAIFLVKHILFHNPSQNVQQMVTLIIPNMICVCPDRVNQVFMEPDMLLKWKAILSEDKNDCNSFIIDSTVFIIANLASESMDNRRKLYNAGIYDRIVELLKEIKQIPHSERSGNDSTVEVRLLWCGVTFYDCCKSDETIYRDPNRFVVMLSIIRDYLTMMECNPKLLDLCSLALLHMTACNQICLYLIDCFPEIIQGCIYWVDVVCQARLTSALTNNKSEVINSLKKSAHTTDQPKSDSMNKSVYRMHQTKSDSIDKSSDQTKIDLVYEIIQHESTNKKVNVSELNIVRFLKLVGDLTGKSVKPSHMILASKFVSNLVLLMHNGSEEERIQIGFILSNLIVDETNDNRFVQKYIVLPHLIKMLSKETSKMVVTQAAYFINNLIQHQMDSYSSLLVNENILEHLKQLQEKFIEDHEEEDEDELLQIDNNTYLLEELLDESISALETFIYTSNKF